MIHRAILCVTCMVKRENEAKVNNRTMKYVWMVIFIHPRFAF